MYWEHYFDWCWNLDTSESRSETLSKLWNIVMERNGEDQMDRSREKMKRKIKKYCIKSREKEHPTYNTTKEG